MRRRDENSTRPSDPDPTPAGPLPDNAFTPALFAALDQRELRARRPRGRAPRPLAGHPPLGRRTAALGRLRARGAGATGDVRRNSRPDLAYLTAAALHLAERPRRFRFQQGADERLHLMHDGAAVATVGSAVLESTSLADDLTRLADLRAQPLALAQFLAAVPAGVLERAGAILLDELRKTR